MMIDIARLVHGLEPYRRRNLGAALEEMYVSLLLNVAAGKDAPITSTEIATALSIPRTNVLRHLKTLKSAGRLRTMGRSYMTDLNYFDATKEDRAQKSRRIVIETALALAARDG